MQATTSRYLTINNHIAIFSNKALHIFAEEQVTITTKDEPRIVGYRNLKDKLWDVTVPKQKENKNVHNINFISN